MQQTTDQEADKVPAQDNGTTQRFRELETLHLASTFLHRLRDPAELARDVITLLKDVVHHDYAAVYLVDGEHLRTFAVSDRGLGPGVLESDFAYLESLRLKVGENITGWVAKHGESVRLDDVSQDDRYLDSQADIQSELCVPMFSGNTVIGVVNLESKRKAAYRDSEQRVLETLANQIAVAIENARLLESMSEMKRLQVLADMTGGVAHDIGNLLVGLSLRCDVLRLRTESAGVQEELNAIGSVLEKAVSLSRNLMQLGLPQPSNTSSIDLNEHLRSTMPLLEALGGRSMAVLPDLCPGNAAIEATPGQIDQILINLVVNARSAVDDGGTLIIRTRFVRNPDDAGDLQGTVLEVEDNGCGMTPETCAAAMEPLFTTRENGSGLGLATVARIVEELHGGIEIQSKQSQGTIVRITLPLSVQNGSAAQAASLSDK